jgi:signal peptidase I
MRLLGLFILFLGVASPPMSALTSSAAGGVPEWVRGIYIGSSPAPLLLPAGAARVTAQHLARQHQQGRVLVGSGQSMAPLYQAGTLMVVYPADFDSLQRGQTVVYRNAARQLVAHVLVAKARDGWRATGLNNGRPDRDGVRADNLVGVVIAAIQPAEDTVLAQH